MPLIRMLHHALSRFAVVTAAATFLAFSVAASAPTTPAPDRHGAPRPAVPLDSANPNGGMLDTLLAQADSLVRANGSNADKAKLYLSWDAPWGMPRAKQVRWPHAHDPLGADTLWLSVLPGRTSIGFLGFIAELYFRAAPGDTLGPWWHMEHGAPNNGAVIAEFGPDEGSFPQRQPWAVGGIPYAKMDRTPRSAHLELIFAVPYTQAVPVDPDSIYTLCRVIFRHRRDMPGSGQPVCIELASCELDYWLKDTPICNRGERFVSYASELPVCDSFRPIVSTPAQGARKSPKTLRPRHPAKPATHR